MHTPVLPSVMSAACLSSVIPAHQVCLTGVCVCAQSATINTPLAISVLWCVYQMIPSALVLMYAYVSRGLMLQYACRLGIILSFFTGACAVGLMWGLYPPNYNFSQVTQMSNFYYAAQKVGTLPNNNPVAWRGNALLGETGPLGRDMTGAGSAGHTLHASMRALLPEALHVLMSSSSLGQQLPSKPCHDLASQMAVSSNLFGWHGRSASPLLESPPLMHCSVRCQVATWWVEPQATCSSACRPPSPSPCWPGACWPSPKATTQPARPRLHWATLHGALTGLSRCGSRAPSLCYPCPAVRLKQGSSLRQRGTRLAPASMVQLVATCHGLDAGMVQVESFPCCMFAPCDLLTRHWQSAVKA